MLRLDTGQMAPVELQTLAELFSMHSTPTQLSPLIQSPLIKEPPTNEDKPSDKVRLIPSQKRRHGGFGYVATMNGYIYHCDYQREGTAGARVYWKCTQRGGCGARLITDKTGNVLNARNNFHSHPPVDESENSAGKSEEKDETQAMGSRKNNYNANLAFVREIYKRRNILFGSTDGLNHNEANLAKEKAWEEVKEAISQLGHQKFKNKDWRQLRANEWQQVRRSAMAKRYLNDLSGAKNPLNELDRLVLEIVGQEEQNGEEGNILEKHPLNLLNFTHKDDQDKSPIVMSPVPQTPNPSVDLFTTLLSQLDPSTVQQIAQTSANEESGDRHVKLEEAPEPMHCSPSSSFDDAMESDAGFENLKLQYLRERYRINIAQERARLELAQKQLSNETQLHEIRVKAEEARLKYEELRLKREQNN